ncbi:MAG TPA: hypothetical protein GXX75_25140 [Clostridiales bacterium]|nr:hypothetical protein [Clostridiales bacterium]
MPKQSRLEEPVTIYQPRELPSEKEKLKNMSLMGKLDYLWEYYKIHALGGILAIAVIIYVIYQVVTPNISTQFYAAIIDNALPPETIEAYTNGFSDHLALDPKLEDIQINDTFYMSGGNNYNMQQALTAYIAAREVDVIIAPESSFLNYARNDYFTKLSEALPTDIYSSLTDSFLLSDTNGDPDKNAYGIYLNDSDLFKGITYDGEPYVLGIVANYPHKENTVEFIHYLFKDLK